MCKYKSPNGRQCPNPNVNDYEYCILHVPLPEDQTSNEYGDLVKLKDKKIVENINLKMYDFDGLKHDTLVLSNLVYTFGSLLFTNAEIKKAIIVNSETWGQLNFSRSKIGEVHITHFKNLWGISFDNSFVENGVDFRDVQIDGDVSFKHATINGYVRLDHLNVSTGMTFEGATINGGIRFGVDSQFLTETIFDNASIRRIESISLATFKGKISLKNTNISDISNRENTFRFAKRYSENIGDKIESDNYYYKEMVAKREQIQNKYRKYFELIVFQWLFGYGVHPIRTFAIWLTTIALFGTFYLLFNAFQQPMQLIEYYYFSMVAAMTPGYGGYAIKPDFQIFAIAEAIFGTFMWAIFISIFVRRFSR